MTRSSLIFQTLPRVVCVVSYWTASDDDNLVGTVDWMSSNHGVHCGKMCQIQPTCNLQCLPPCSDGTRMTAPITDPRSKVFKNALVILWTHHPEERIVQYAGKEMLPRTSVIFSPPFICSRSGLHTLTALPLAPNSRHGQVQADNRLVRCSASKNWMAHQVPKIESELPKLD